MRKIEEVQAEYNKACAALGDREYRVHCLQAEAADIKNKLAELNKEASAIQKESVSEQSEAPKSE